MLKLEGVGLKAEPLTPYVPLAEMIEAFRIKPDNRQAETWIEHREINMVMLAASLSPDGCLTL